MPTCREMAELVTDYLEHTLPLRVRLAARRHLFLCDACTNYFGQMRRTISLLRQGRAAESPQPDEEGILRRLRDEKPPPG